jgi:hypothetical protein
MENLVDHIVSGLALLLGVLAAWFARRAGKSQSRQTLEALVRDACDYALAHPSPGITTERVALDAVHLLDVRADGKQDFKDDAQLMVAIRAELARRSR